MQTARAKDKRTKKEKKGKKKEGKQKREYCARDAIDLCIQSSRVSSEVVSVNQGKPQTPEQGEASQSEAQINKERL